MAKNLYNLPAVTTVSDSDLLHVNQGSVSADKKVTKANLLKEVNAKLARTAVSVSPNLSGITIAANSSFEMDGIVVLNIRATFESDVASNQSLISVPAPKTTLSGGSGVVACALNNTSFAASVVANGFIANNGALTAGTYLFSAVYEKA